MKILLQIITLPLALTSTVIGVAYIDSVLRDIPHSFEHIPLSYVEIFWIFIICMAISAFSVFISIFERKTRE